MSNRASYMEGFAPRDGKPRFPELWQGCVGAWAPCLGHSGNTLRDWSGGRANSSLTAGITWSPDSSRYSLVFSTGNYGVVSSNKFTTANSRSWAAWVKTTQSTGATIFNYNGSLYTSWLYVNSPAGPSGTAGKASFAVYTSTYYKATGNTTVNDGNWHHIAGVYNKSASTVAIYVDGKLETTTSVVGSQGSENDYLFMGVLGNGTASGAAEYLVGSMSDARVYDRVLSSSEISLLALRPGIAYELAPRRRASAAVAGFNRRRRLLVGAG